MIYFSYSFYKKGKIKMYIFEDLIGYIFLASLLGIILTIIIGDNVKIKFTKMDRLIFTNLDHII